MGKALMATGSLVAITSADECNVFTSTDSLGETAQSYSATEACRFSRLGINITAGGSGTNNWQFRKNGANGNQLASRAGTGSVEDAINTDLLAATDTFNLAYTDTGTDSTQAWRKMNVEFIARHGKFCAMHASAGGVCDAESATRFLSVNGGFNLADGATTEAEAAFKNRAYDIFAAMQVRVSANARVNDSVFKNRINSGDGTASITFGAGVTGLLTHVGLSDAIADGQVVGASLTLLAGLEDLTLIFVGATLISTANKSDCVTQSLAGTARTASATANYFTLGGASVIHTTDAAARVKPGFIGRASNLRCYVGANTYTGNATLKLYQNGAAVITVTITAGAANQWFEDASTIVDFDADDEFSFELDEGTSGSATFYMLVVTLEDLEGRRNDPVRVSQAVHRAASW